MENRIKEQQLYVFADGTSCHALWPNQFRLLLSNSYSHQALFYSAVAQLKPG